MSVSVKNNPLSRVFLVTLVMPLFLTACATAGSGAMTQPCRTACRIPIELPDDKPSPPTVPEERYHVTGSTNVNFTVVAGDAKAASTLLVFERPAFVDSNGTEIYVLTVHPGNSGNTYKTVKHIQRCPSGVDCNEYKYTVVNYGTPEREPLDPWIIIE